VPGFCTSTHINKTEWAPGAYIEAAEHDVASLKKQSDWLMRSLVAFHAQFAPELEEFLAYLKRDETPIPQTYDEIVGKKPKPFPGEGPNQISDLFYLYYGQGQLENKENLANGPCPVISSTGTDNGCYGFYDFDNLAPLIKAPFVTVPRTGSIGEAFVQLWPCGVTSDCVLLIPKADTDFEDLFIAAATVRLERWRFNYGRKITPARIANMKLDRAPELKRHIRASYDNGHRLMRGVQVALSPSEIDDSFEERIKRLVDTWRKETGHLSSIDRKVLHPAYQEIISTGERGLPFILRELKSRGGHWFWALRFMAGVDPGVPNQTVEELRNSWLAWGKKKGYTGL